MKNLYLGLQRFVNDEEGVTAIEYALIASLIAVVIIAAVQLTGQNVNAVFQRVAAALAVAPAGP
ncbi:MAG: Flp family type IVb pilin [Methylotenera sp.]|nr:Flp family type IVb pilin [Methylotenera sp.]MDP2281996.1 Flp family type IVb pilin [Methylotenera sp.]MDP3060994.1 Flp family type IVb pilin [Methylotenera sp.]